jgi:hypothetical protein
MTGRVIRFVAPRRVELDEVEVREPADGELLVRAEYSGISGGTEMLAYRGEVDGELALDEALEALGGTFAYVRLRLQRRGPRRAVARHAPGGRTRRGRSPGGARPASR